MLRYFLLLLLVPIFSNAQLQQKFNVKEEFVAKKNYFLLYKLYTAPQNIKNALNNNKHFNEIHKQKLASIKLALENNYKSGFENVEIFKFNKDELAEGSTAFAELYNADKNFKNWVDENILASKKYSAAGTAVATLQNAWLADANGINGVIDMYAFGKPPIYPKIDSISFNTKEKNYPFYLSQLAEVVHDEIKGDANFFTPGFIMALRLLELNGRFEAADYEPMQTIANRPAMELAKKINWKDYPYSFILVPGAGTDNYTDSINPAGILRCRMALRYFNNKMAPFIIVSGGRVHPYKTVYSEANEMKEYLVHVLGVPEKNVIIEPHARHTTTNIRNANRLAIAYRIPVTKKALIVTDRFQSAYITNKNFDERCLKELGYVPYIIGKRLTPTAFEYTPLENSLIINSKEPLDP